jgi:tol-pal system protein YbgF
MEAAGNGRLDAPGRRSFAMKLFLLRTSVLLVAAAASGITLAQAEVNPPADVEERVQQVETRSNNLFAQLFGRGDEEPRPRGDVGQGGASELAVRLDRIENQMRQLTGAVEQMQYRNQQLEQQLKRLQSDIDYRFQEMTPQGRGTPPRTQQQAPAVIQAPPPGPQQPQVPGRRGDVFDPEQNPNAPGVPRQLGGGGGGVPLRGGPNPVVASTPGNIPARQPGTPIEIGSPAQIGDQQDIPPAGRALPPGQQQAVLAPSGNAKDEYDLAYGYLLRRDYQLADEAFRNYLRNHPRDRMVPEANFWLGESLYQRQQYNDAGEVFLDLYNKYPNSLKAPDALLRLGQSLAVLGKQEAACAAFGAIATKYPRASANVKQSVEREQKRARC